MRFGTEQENNLNCRNRLLRRRMHGIVLPEFLNIAEEVSFASITLKEAIDMVLDALQVSKQTDAQSISIRKSKNAAAVVKLSQGNEVFIKVGSTSHLSYENEVYMLSLLKNLDLDDFDRFHPDYIYWNEQYNILATTSVYSGREHRIFDGVKFKENAPSLLCGIAQTLARLHSLHVDYKTLAADDRLGVFPLDSLCDITVREFSYGVGKEYHKFVTTVQSIQNELDELRLSEFDGCLVHGDIRHPNILFAQDTRLPVLVDWEMASFSDPAQDVGALFADLLSLDLFESSNTRNAMVACLWVFQCYNDSLSKPFDKYFRFRVVSYTGIHLIRHALGRLEHQGTLNTIGHLQLAIGQSLVKDPRKGGVMLCG